MYFLMNKNLLVAEFEVVRSKDKSESCVVGQVYESLPLDFKDIDSWVKGRFCGLSREKLMCVVRGYIGTSFIDKINLTHCISITDTFWVKSRFEHIGWAEISPYRNTIASGTGGMILKGTIHDCYLFEDRLVPETALDGMYDKCCLTKNDKLKIYKTDINDKGLSCWCEWLSKYIYKELCPKYVDYDLDTYQDLYVTTCDIFTSNGTGFIPYGACQFDKSIPKIVKSYDCVGAAENFAGMLIGDALCINEDRHAGNHGFLFDTDNLMLLDMAPVYDGNEAFGAGVSDDELGKLNDYLSSEDPIPFNNLIFLAKIVLNDKLRKKLSEMWDFKLPYAGGSVFTEERVDIMNKIIRKHIERILE